MALDVNGYNATFRMFADFAQKSIDAGQKKAIANIGTQALNGRNIKVVVASKTDSVGGLFTRTLTEESRNNATRSAFLRAVAGMFGGSKNIPPEVMKALNLDDYGHGQPLTARRIMAVKTAIDASGVAKARSAELKRQAEVAREDAKLNVFTDKASEVEALKAGFLKTELPKVARATRFYAQAKGCSEAEALKEICTPNSKANRLMGYGGRFLENAANFTDGLRLLDDFAAWYKDIRDTMRDGKSGFDKTFSKADTVTKCNIETGMLTADVSPGLERVIFADIAADRNFNLAETDAEKAFGFENNATTRFLLRDGSESSLQTVAGLTPAKRALLYKTHEMFLPFASNRNEAVELYNKHGSDKKFASPAMHSARVLKNYDKLAALDAKGQLTPKNVIKTCYPEIKRGGNWDIHTIRAFDDVWLAKVEDKIGVNAQLNIQLTMEATGCTIDEAIDAYKKGKVLPPYADYSPVSYPLNEFDGTTAAARNGLLGSAGDLARPYNYSMSGDPEEKPLLAEKDFHFGFAFQDGEKLQAGGGDKIPGNVRVADKIEKMCGRMHAKQASAVMFAVSQAGTMQLKNGLRAFGIESSEHACVDFALSRDDKTGAITVKYSSPEALPIRFSWTATIDLDGKITATPMSVEKPVELTTASAKKMLGAAAKEMGVKLSKNHLAAGAALLAGHGKGMYAKNASYLAHFIAKAPLDSPKADRVEKTKKAIAAFAKEIKQWRDFDHLDNRHAEISKAAVRHHNDYIRECVGNDDKFVKENGKATDIFRTFRDDANRNNYSFNGKKFPVGSKKEDVMGAFKAALPQKAHRAMSVLMCQASGFFLVPLTMNAPNPENDGTVSQYHKLPCGGDFVQRDFMRGDHIQPMFDSSMSYNLSVAKDGKSATLEIVHDGKLLTGRDKEETFGNAQIRETMTIDLTKDVPEITDIKFAQKLM